MIVGNWMKRIPLTLYGDTLVSEAKQLMADHGLQALPVVDDAGRLRGLVTRSNLMRLEHFVLRTQSQDELSFFSERLRVRDVMVRNPGTVRIDDTMDHCMRKGKELNVAQLLVMQEGRVVGVISATEIFELAAHAIGAWEKRNGLTLAPIRLGPGVLGRIADVVQGTGAQIRAIFPMPAPDGEADGLNTVVLRFRSDSVSGVVRALERAGFAVSSWSQQPAAEMAA